jgi:hypothetical protein
MTAVWFVVILATVAVKPAVVDPAETVTEAGTVTTALLLDNDTEAPPAGAGSVSVAVQEEVPGAFTAVGLQEMLVRLGGPFSVRVAVCEAP